MTDSRPTAARRLAARRRIQLVSMLSRAFCGSLVVNVLLGLAVPAPTFALDTYSLTTTVVGGGTVARNPDQAAYDEGTSVELTASANAGWTFVGWSGDVAGADNPLWVTIDGNKSITAMFVINTYTLAVAVDSVGSGSVTKNPDQASYDHGTSVELTAAAASGYHFVGWSGDLSGTTNPQSLLMDGEKSVSATFAVNLYTITATAGAGGSISPAGPQPVTHGSVQGFTITPDAGHHVLDVVVDGGSVGAVASYTFSDVQGDHTIEASFALNSYSLATAVVGSGTVSRNPDQASYDHGTSVELTAAPSSGYHFVGWSGDLSGTTNPQSLTMDGEKSVSATFALNVYTITATAGAGGSISPAGAQPVTHGSAQGFTITPEVGHHVLEVVVDGGSVGAVASYTFSDVQADHTIGATFALNSYSLATAVVGSGTVGQNPDQASYDHGTSVELTAAPSSGYHFVGWSGDLSGTINPQSLLMDGEKSVSATFAVNTYTLTTTVVGSGTVSRSPDQGSYDHGTMVQLTATPQPGYKFTGWSGAATGTSNPLSVTMDADKNITAAFVASGAALQFDGVDDYVTFGPSSSLGVQTFTIEVRFKRTGAGVTTSTGSGGVVAVPLVAKGRAQSDGSNLDMNYFLGINGSNRLAADFEDMASGGNHRVTGTTMIANDVWYHAAVTFDGSSLTLYLNGLVQGSVSTTALPRFDSIQHAALGSALNSSGIAAGFFQGLLDEARIWNLARTQQQIQDNMGMELLAGPGLVARWGLNEDTGTGAGNSAANGVNGTLSNGPVWTTDSPLPLAAAIGVRFGGTNAHVDLGDPLDLDLSQFTVECWFRRDGPGVATATGVDGIPDMVPLVTKGAAEVDAGDDRDFNYVLGIRGSDGVLCADFEEGAGGAAPSSNHPVAGVTPISLGTWHHAAATYDGATWHLYLDGSPEATLAVGQPVRSNSVQPAALATCLTSSGVPQGFFSGALDEVRIWSYARTESEIESTVNSELTAPVGGLVARWGLDEDAGVTAGNTAGATPSGAITASDWSWAAGSPFNAPPPAPPADPSSLAGTAVTHSQIDLSWVDNATNESRYEVERSTSEVGGAYSLLATLPANRTSYADVQLDASTEYCYRVRAGNNTGPSGYSAPACVTTPAPFNTGLDFAGGTYASFGDPATLHLSRFTIEMWVRRDGAGVGTRTGEGGIADLIPLVAKGRGGVEDSTRDVNYIFGLRASDGVLAADFEEGPGGASPSQNHPVVGVTPLSTGVWHHVAATYDGTAWKLYLDGNLDVQSVVGQPVASASTVVLALGSALAPAGAAEGFFDGAVDEVRIWNLARTQAEIQATGNAQLMAPQTGLVARWALGEGSGATVCDSAGTSVNGTITGSSFSWVPGAPFDLAFNLPPALPALHAPAGNAAGVSGNPTLDVEVSDPESGNLTVTYYGRALATTPGPDFTLIGLPDTQNYTGEINGGTNAIFQGQTHWVVDNRVARNIAYVAPLGDCVDRGDDGIEWQRADTSFSVLEDPGTTGLPEGIPFGVSVGDQDQTPSGDADGSTALYNQLFGASRFQGRAYYGGHYGTNNDNWYGLFSASGMDFIVVSLEHDQTPDAPVLAWASDLLATHGDRRAIVVSHHLCDTGDPASFRPQGWAIYDALKGHPNLFLMLGGHVTGEGRRSDTYLGNTVHTLASNYQYRANGGDGWLRILEFSPVNGVIRVRTYSPWLNQFETDGDSQFDLAHDMSGPTPFQPIGSVTVPSGSHATIGWPNLAPSTAYEWYATVSDGSITTTGPAWRFTTTSDGVPPSVSVVSPNAPTTLMIASVATLQWNASDNMGVTSVDLLLSRDGAAGSYAPIATAIANSGTYDWTVTGPPTADAFLKVVAHDAGGNAAEDLSDLGFEIVEAIVGVGESPVTEFAMGPVTPNPAVRDVQLTVALPREARVRLSVLDVQGREVAVLAEGTYAAGRHSLRWDGRGAHGQRTSGLYFLRLRVPGKTFVRRAVIVR